MFVEKVRSNHGGSHVLLQTAATNGEHILHVNARDESAFFGEYVLANDVSLRYRMWPPVPPHYR